MKKIVFLFVILLLVSCGKKTKVEQTVYTPPAVVPKPSEINAERKKRIEEQRLLEEKEALSKKEVIEIEENQNKIESENIEITQEEQVVNENEIIDENIILTEDDYSLYKGDEQIKLYEQVKNISFFDQTNIDYSIGKLRMGNFDGLKLTWNTRLKERTNIYKIQTESETYNTPRNIHVGSTLQEVFDAYGQININSNGRLSYEMGSSEYECILVLLFTIVDDKVTKIEIFGGN